MKSATLQKITQLLASLQKRISKTTDIARQNAGQILIAADKIKENAAAVEFVRAQAFQRSEQIGLALANVKKENDDREMRQTMRDQNNVVSLTALRDSTAKAFNQLKADVQELINRDTRISARVDAIAQETLSSAAVQSRLPVGHEWVNKKLTGVYDSVESLEARLEKAEKLIALYEKLRKAQADLAKVNNEFLS